MRVENPTAVPVDIQEFGPGDHVWVMPDGAKLVQVAVIAGGGGGQSGQRRTPTTEFLGTNGGIAGDGGGWAMMTFPASTVTPGVAVAVGAGGLGDAGATVVGEYGSGGTDGGPTSFGAYLAVPGGRYLNLSGVPIPSMLTPGSGAAAAGADAPGCPGGGLGGGFLIEDSSHLENVTISDGFPGGRSTITAGTPAPGGTASGGVDGTDGADTLTGQPMPGTAGAGGAASLTGNSGDGGDGGNYGAGGGGGGASGDDFPSGNGGRGGDGICVVITYF